MTIAFIDLWRGHPINESVAAPCVADAAFTNLEGKVIEVGYPVYANQCAIRMGVALRRAGVTDKMLGRTTTCGHHPRDEMHIINANQLAIAIKAANLPGFAPVEVMAGADSAQFYQRLFGRTGVIFVKDYWHRSTDKQDTPTGDHIDVWNGYRSSAKMLMEWFFWLGYTSNYAGAKELWFWEVK